jgi:hypothetical protein
MHTIEKRFDDDSRPNNKGLLRLKSNQPIVLSGQSWPIVWSGYLNGNEVSVIQESGSSSDPSNYELKDFPRKYEWLKGEIVDLVDDEFRAID